MKNQKDIPVIFLCILFTVFLCGIFIGRTTSHYPIDLTENNRNNSANSVTSSELIIDSKMNINVATVEDLMLIPSIGEITAQNIVAYREAHGAFQSLSDLSKVEGLGADRILQLIDYITIGGTHENTGR